MGRHALALAAAALLLQVGLASSLLVAGAVGAGGTTSTGTTPVTGTVTTVPANAVLAVTGRGFGHGLGLSQWGAEGYAEHGLAYDRILAHYYPGTTLGKTATSRVRVLLASGRKAVLAATAPWTVTDASGATADLDPARAVTLKAPLVLSGHEDLHAPFTFSSRAPLLLGGKAYRGRLVVSGDGRTVQVVGVLGLEAYLKGVVPAEMPSRWNPEALKAQAVAARSYALANLATGRPYDLYGDTRSQAYGGVAVESPATSAAVDATRAQVLLYGGKVADTLFFSTSGGRTASSLEAMGIDVPYLVPVADPYDDASPYHEWGPVLLDAKAVQKAFKLSAPLAGVAVATGASGRVRSLTLTSGLDTQVTVTGNQARTVLGLRSTWFTPSFVQLRPAAATMTYGGAVSLTGTAPGAAAASLEAKPYGASDWAPSAALAPAAGGAFSAIVRPQVTTRYRLAWDDARIGLVKVSVAPRVAAAATPAGVSGTIRPAVAGAPVQLQQQTGAAWTTVATTLADAAGAWQFAGPLGAGSYRVRAVPGGGLAPGVSSTVTES